MNALKIDRYTYKDYAKWDDDVRCELIDGIVYDMAAPGDRHQLVSGNLFAALHNYLQKKPCRPFAAPYDVRLNADGKDDTVVQPDIIVICDRSKRDEKCCKGVPDMVVEILSPSTARHDWLVKYNLYMKYGVREFWVIDPETNLVHKHVYKDGGYYKEVYGEEDAVGSHVLDGFSVNVAEIFAE